MISRIPLAILLAGTLAGPVLAEEEEGKLLDVPGVVLGVPEQCIQLNRIDRTEVIDDQNVLFRMRNGDTYLNQLPYRCPSLGFHESFMYRTSLNQLCNVDIITVLNDAGFGFLPGPSCGLGLFYPITKDDVDKIREDAKRGKDKKSD